MSARTRAAIDEAAQSNWRIDDLQAWAGGLIAEATGAEAGWVTSGAAAGLTLAAAACVAGTRLEEIDRLPEPGAVPSEIIVQRGHRNAYDRQLRNVGARLVEVGYPANEGIGATLEWQLEAAFGERTVAVCAPGVRRPPRPAAGSRLRDRPRPRRPGAGRRRCRAAAAREPAPLHGRRRRRRVLLRRQGDPRPAGFRRARHHARARALGAATGPGYGRGRGRVARHARERSRRTTASAGGSRSGRRRSPASRRRCRSSASATSTPRRPTPPTGSPRCRARS